MDDLEKNIASKLETAEERMQKTIEAFKRDIANIRSTRASVSMLDQIQVDYYGTPTPVNQLASISVPEARMLLINPYDKGVLADLEKALFKSDIGITPQNDGSVIRLIMPDMSGERRQELVKQLQARLEEARVALRNVRRDTNEELKKWKGSGLSEDELKLRQEEVQKLTDSKIKHCEELAGQKKEGILTV